MSKKVALVIGASGLVGGNLATHMGQQAGWRALGVSRRRPARPIGYEHLSFDLLDTDQCKTALAAHPDITHVYVAARTKGGTPLQEEQNNVAVIRNLLDTLEQTSPELEHVHLVHGTKWYASHLPGTLPPFRESDPRFMTPNPYYAQHDYIAKRQQGRGWSWSTSRPTLVLGFSTGYPHNIVCLVGVLASICRELGMSWRFPGTDWCYQSLQTATDMDLLCRAIVFMSTSEQGKNESFNVANGDVFSWSRLWPQVGKSFGMETGNPQPFSLVEYLSDKEPVWQRIVQKHGLQATTLSDLVAWSYGDFHFNKQSSDICSLVKLNHIGFYEMTDTEALFLKTLNRYRKEKVLPY